jgi:chloride channel 7
LEIAVVSVLTSAVLFYTPHVSWACKIVASKETQADKRFFCKQGEINEMATAMLGSRISAIKDILADPSAYQQKTLVTMGGVFYFLTLITFGSCIPSGLFTPTILVGAALGGACGNLFAEFIDESIAPSTYALLGVASMLAGIQRSTVSVAVILVEGTGTMKVLLPTIIVVAISRYVAQIIHPLGIFEAAISFKKLPYLDHEKIPQYYDAVTVADILTDSPLCLKCNEMVKDLADALNTTTYDSFPVVDENQRFLGLVKRQQVAALLESGIFSKDKISARDENFEVEIAADEHMPLFYWAYCINDDRYGHIIQLPEEVVEEVAITYDSMQNHDFTKSMRMAILRKSSSQSYHPPEEVSFCQIGRNDTGCIIVSSVDFHHREYWVDIGSVANKGTYTVCSFCPVSKAYHLFTSLGLSHIVVLDEGEVLGVLSRNNFLPKHIEEHSGL